MPEVGDGGYITVEGDGIEYIFIESNPFFTFLKQKTDATTEPGKIMIYNNPENNTTLQEINKIKDGDLLQNISDEINKIAEAITG